MKWFDACGLRYRCKVKDLGTYLSTWQPGRRLADQDHL